MIAATSNADDPAVFYYSADPTNVFSPVYTISPTGAEDVISTDASGDVIGTQEFTVSYFGIPLDTFNGGVEYATVSSPLDLFGSPYVEDVSTLARRYFIAVIRSRASDETRAFPYDDDRR